MQSRTPIYHFTPIRNLPSILKSGKIICKSQLALAGIEYEDIAIEDIHRRRARTHVPCGPGSMLPDYVPFFFAWRSPMLYYISKNVHNYPEGQEPLVYLVGYAQDVQTHGLPFVFTDGHPIMKLTNFYDDLAHRDQVDWAVMRSRMWNDTSEDPDRQRRREAEFLVYQAYPWELVTGLAVINDRMRQRLKQVLEVADHKPPIVIRSNWYY